MKLGAIQQSAQGRSLALHAGLEGSGRGSTDMHYKLRGGMYIPFVADAGHGIELRVNVHHHDVARQSQGGCEMGTVHVGYIELGLALW